MLNKQIFAQNITMLAEIYDRTLTKTLQSVYYAVLSEMSDEDFKQAIKRLLQERVFATFPKPAEILSLSNVKKVATIEINESKSKAEKLISGVETMNTVLWNEAKDLKRVFEDYVRMYEFENVCDETKTILNNVAPHYSIAELTINIRKYQTGIDAVNAFERAIEQTDKSDAVQIGNSIERVRIKR